MSCGGDTPPLGVMDYASTDREAYQGNPAIIIYADTLITEHMKTISDSVMRSPATADVDSLENQHNLLMQKFDDKFGSARLPLYKRIDASAIRVVCVPLRNQITIADIGAARKPYLMRHWSNDNFFEYYLSMDEDVEIKLPERKAEEHIKSLYKTMIKELPDEPDRKRIAEINNYYEYLQIHDHIRITNTLSYDSFKETPFGGRLVGYAGPQKDTILGGTRIYEMGQSEKDEIARQMYRQFWLWNYFIENFVPRPISLDEIDVRPAGLAAVSNTKEDLPTTILEGECGVSAGVKSEITFFGYELQQECRVGFELRTTLKKVE